MTSQSHYGEEKKKYVKKLQKCQKLTSDFTQSYL